MMNEQFEYQYSMHQNELDCFFELEGMGQPNMHRLVTSVPCTKSMFRTAIEQMRNGEQPNFIKSCGPVW